MPLETQGKIVRVLQEQTFERVGGSNRVEVDVRVIASTNRDLPAEIAAGPFPRGSVLSAERRADPDARRCASGARTFRCWRAISSSRVAEAAGLPSREFGEDALAALQAYDWPGNVRQLRNVDRLAADHGAGRAARGDPRRHAADRDQRDRAVAWCRWDKGGEIMSLPLRDAREVFEREYLLAQVTRFGGNISRTAAFVGMERSALHRKLKSLGVAYQRPGRSRTE